MPSFESKLWHTARRDNYSWEREGTETKRKAERASLLGMTITPPAKH